MIPCVLVSEAKPTLRWNPKTAPDAYRSGDRFLYNQARNTLTKEIRVIKRSYTEKVKNRFSVNNPASVWKSIQDITNYRKSSPHAVENHHSPTPTSNNHLQNWDDIGFQEPPNTTPHLHTKQHCVFRFLGSTISQDLKWVSNINTIIII